MSKKVLCLLMVAVMVIVLAFTGCDKTEPQTETEKDTTTEEVQETEAEEGTEATEAPEAEPTPNTKKYVLKFATSSVPTDAHTLALTAFKEALELTTDGQIEVEIYHSGSLYKQDELLPSVIKGNLEMCYVSAGTIAKQMPSVSMFSAGYLFKSYEHADAVLNGEIGEQVFEEIAQELGVRPLGSFYLGARQINTTDIGREVKTPADLEGVKLRMPGSEAWLFLGEALGATPTPLAFGEVYMALKTGTIDGQDNPLPTVKNSKLYEVTTNISLTNHYISTVWPTINEELWQEMGPELQEKIKDALAIAQKVCDETNIQAEAELVEFFIEEGLTVTEPDIDAFSTHVQEMYMNNTELTATWDMDLYQQIVDMGN